MKVNNIKYREERKKFENRLFWLQLGVNLFCCIFIIYLFFNQIIDIRHLKDKGRAQRSMKSSIMRGSIVDRNGIKLANDSGTYRIFIHPKNFNDDMDKPKRLAELIAPVVGMKTKDVENKIRTASSKGSIQLLKKDANRDMINKLSGMHLSNVWSKEPTRERIYPQGTMASHVLGYFNPYAEIAAGVEKTADDKLTYIENQIYAEKKVSGDIIYDFMTDPEAITGPQIGQTVTLTLDSAIQHVCETELHKVIKERKAYRGTIIVTNPRNGEILGYAVYPYYNPNDIRKASQLQLKNWTLTDVYEPGSTFKVLTVASALELGKINEKTRVEDTGKIKIDKWEIENHDYHKNPHPGLINLEYLFEHSSNVGSIKVVQKMTSEEFSGMLKNFGFGSRTGIDLPAESRGLLPQKWSKVTHLNTGIGYSVAVTPMQMVNAISSIANNGVKVTPHVIKYSEDEAAAKVSAQRVMSEDNAKKLTKILYKSIENSTAPEKMDNYYVAAKTGTSRKLREGRPGYEKDKLYASIIGYLPATNPQILIYVIVDSAQVGPVWGATVAAPVFKEVATQVVRILNIPPDKIKK